MDLTRLTIKEIRDGLARKEFSSEEVLRASIARVEKVNETTNAFLEVYADEALAAAKATDKKIAAGESLKPLEGIAIALKDNLLNTDHEVTASSKILEGYRSPYSATVVDKLREQGAIFMGRTNMDEFAMGSSTESSAWGVTRNPWNLERVPGGSSGGSTAAVAADLCAAAFGSDTGGSIRQPAALCGVVGLKPTYGRVSRYGLIAMASSLDQIGPVTKTVEDAAELLSVIEGSDPQDSTTEDHAPTEWKRRSDLKGLKIGLPKEYFDGIADSPMEGAMNRAIETLKGLGAEVRPVSLPHAAYALAVYYVLMPAEVSSNLSRFDGIRFGPRAAASTLKELYRETRGTLFGDEARRRIMLGTFVLSSGYYDAYYAKAQQARTLVSRDYTKAFEEVDVMLTPTSPTTAWKIGEKMNDPLAMYLADIDTVSVNVAGIPAISIPSELIDGLPVGVQLIGPKWGEGTILSVADCAEKAFGFREKYRPQI